jgi:hypothetical protein
MKVMEIEGGRVVRLGTDYLSQMGTYLIFNAARVFRFELATACLRRSVAVHAYFEGNSYSGEIPIDADSAIYTILGMNTPTRNKNLNSALHLEVVWA